MKVFKLDSVIFKKDIKAEVIKALVGGKIFIYPTDTVYGIGCNVNYKESIQRIYEIKKRSPSKPFSIIVPSLEWIEENCKVSKNGMRFIASLLPGPYTLILKVKNYEALKAVSREGKIGIRMPKNIFTDLIRSLNILFITTSANVSGEKPASSVKEIPQDVKGRVDYIIDGGKLRGIPSRIFDLTRGLKIVRY